MPGARRAGGRDTTGYSVRPASPAGWQEEHRSPVREGKLCAVTETAGKYARFELERRFLVAQLPKRIAQADAWLIEDRYITGTQLGSVRRSV